MNKKLYSLQEISQLIWSHRKNQFGVTKQYTHQLISDGLLKNIRPVKVGGRMIGIQLTCDQEKFKRETKMIFRGVNAPRRFSMPANL